MQTLGVIIPVGAHHASLVSDALHSIAMGSEKPTVVVVVDDHADPPAAQHHVLELPDVRYAKLEDTRGRSAARNLGCHLADTDWFYFLDADDLLMPTAVTDWREAIERDPTIQLVYANYRWTFGPSADLARPYQIRDDVPWDRDVLRRKMIGNIGMFVRADRFWAVGGFTPGRDYGEEYDLWLRYALNPAINVYKHTRPLFHSRKGLHTVEKAGSHWTQAVAQIAQAVNRGEYAAWESR